MNLIFGRLEFMFSEEAKQIWQNLPVLPWHYKYSTIIKAKYGLLIKDKLYKDRQTDRSWFSPNGILNFGSLCLGKTSFKWIPHWMSDHLSRQPFNSNERIARVVLLAIFSRVFLPFFDFSAFLTSQVCFHWEITTVWIQKIAIFF